jgi:cytochrome b6-f complex iron-sulfur subunit
MVRVAEAPGILIAVAAVSLFVLSRRRRPMQAATAPDAPTRRAFLNRAMLGSLTVFGVTLTGGSIASLWPTVRPGRFGSKIVAGHVDDLHQQIETTKMPVYNLTGRFYIVKYRYTDPDNPYVRAGAVAGGLMALYQKCSHLGCRVPFCPTSQYFECPCHDARFNLAGERQPGSPAPAGLWRFPIHIDENGYLVVDTSLRVAQPPAGTDTIHQQPQGAYCVN